MFHRRDRSLAGVVLAAATVSCVMAGCANGPGPTLPSGTLTISRGSSVATLDVRIAETPAARETGLMRRHSLAPDGGMAFLFAQPTTSPFWMKDTLIPLSIAFWSSDRRIVAILEMTPCRSDPCPYYYPHRTYVGAVEARGGFFADHHVQIGDAVALDRTPSP